MRCAWLNILVLIFVVAASLEAVAQPVPQRPDDVRTIPVQFKDSPIADVVTSIGQATNTSFIYDDKLRGSITITVPGMVTANEALELLNAALFMRGFAGIPIEGGVVKIVSLREAASSSEVAAESGPPTPDSDRSILTMLRLDHAGAVPVSEILGNYVSKNGRVVAYEPTNSLILSGAESQLRRLFYIAEVLDRAAEENVMAKVLRYRTAEQVAEIIEVVFNEGTVEAFQVDLWTDDRANMIVARASPSRLAELRLFIGDLDQPPQSTGNMHVVFIHNRDAEDIAKIIESFAKPTPAASASARRPQALASPGVGAELTGRDFGLTVDPPTRSLVVRADPETFELIRKLVDQLDKIPPRVSVEVAIMEISRPAGFQLGINLFVPLNVPEDRTDPISFFRSPTGGESLIPGPASASSASQLFAGYARNPIQLTLTDASGATIPFTVPQASASIEAGEQSVETSLLIRPQLVVLSGEEHEIFVGNNVPVPVAANTQQAGGEQVAAPGFLPSQTVRQNIERVDIGVGLRIRPLVGEQGVVLLEVDLEISDTTESLAGDTKRVGPTFIRQNIHSTLRLNSARHAVIGAYTGQSVSGRRSGVPFLMDIPVLGYFFSQVSKQRMDNSVVAIVSARVLRTHEEDIAESIRRRLAFERSISRTFDVRRLSDAPYAVLLETTSSELLARRIALGFEDDGYPTRVTEWALDGESRWDVYLTEIESFEAAGDLANQLLGADWNPRITVLAAENEFAIE